MQLCLDIATPNFNIYILFNDLVTLLLGLFL